MKGGGEEKRAKTFVENEGKVVQIDVRNLN